MTKSTHIIVMAKAPRAGFAKTRLIPELGAEGAATLAKRMLQCSVSTAVSADIGSVELCVTPGPEDSHWADITFEENIRWSAQTEGDLGARLSHVCVHAFKKHDAMLIMGTDCPALTPQILRRAADALRRFNAVIIPAHDGGYTLLGLNEFHASVFEGINWSSSQVCAQTLVRLNSLGWSTEILPTLNDIDEPDDLRWLPPHWPEYCQPQVINP